MRGEMMLFVEQKFGIHLDCRAAVILKMALYSLVFSLLNPMSTYSQTSCTNIINVNPRHLEGIDLIAIAKIDKITQLPAVRARSDDSLPLEYKDIAEIKMHFIDIVRTSKIERGLFYNIIFMRSRDYVTHDSKYSQKRESFTLAKNKINFNEDIEYLVLLKDSRKSMAVFDINTTNAFVGGKIRYSDFVAGECSLIAISKNKDEKEIRNWIEMVRTL